VGGSLCCGVYFTIKKRRFCLMRILVTGGTGLLGNNILRQLAGNASDTIIALVRQEPDPDVFGDLPLEFVRGDLRPSERESRNVETGDRAANDSASAEIGSVAATSLDHLDDAQQATDLERLTDLEQAIEASDVVIHAAAYIHLGWTQEAQSLAVNQRGTARVAEACLRFTKRLVYIGTVNTLAVGSPQLLADEETPLGFSGGQVPCSYVVSKRAGVAEVLRRIEQGLDAVILHPAFMLGPWDWKPSSGRMMLEVAKAWKPIAPRGGCSLCDVRDVAATVISAAKQPSFRRSEYILAGHNWTYLRLWTEMAKRVNRRPPIRATGPGTEYLAGLAGDLWGKLSGREGDLNGAGARMSGQFHWYDSSRAIKELGYCVRDPQEILDDAAEWIRDRFILPSRPSNQ
ncbi:MAG: NAD-dependent epimerase/dehydratase family protein, partial [Planctomycetota bacterium]